MTIPWSVCFPCESARSSSTRASRPGTSRNDASSTIRVLWRRRRLIATSIRIASFGRASRYRLKSVRSRSSRVEASCAIASADRGSPSSRAISPKNSPGPLSARMTSLPCADVAAMRTRPDSIKYMVDPGSPWTTMTSPFRYRRRRRLTLSSSSSREDSSPRRETWARALRTEAIAAIGAVPTVFLQVRSCNLAGGQMALGEGVKHFIDSGSAPAYAGDHHPGWRRQLSKQPERTGPIPGSRSNHEPVKLIAGAASVLVWVSILPPWPGPACQIGPAPAVRPPSTQSPAAPSPTPAVGPSQTPPGQTGTGQAPPSNLKVGRPSQPLMLATSPGGEFSVAIPAGWTINPSQDGQTFPLTPRGQADPSIACSAAIPVSDLRATEVAAYCAQTATADALTCSETELSYQLSDAQHAWSATESFQALVQALSQLTKVQYGPPRITPLSQVSATYEVTQQTRGATLDDWGMIAMGYLNNPTFQVNSNSAYTSLALVTGCEASPDQVASMRLICKQALTWFRRREWRPHDTAQ